eukprot:TRINITY_DN26889_c0_g1_i4.p1 TRINITY_DN26889_c0_g1~~TRINITY_DN26889_c0_g1_i4.p1  ORF type:complete len:637 (+),score=105.47 TRINITY_DN26889_c0_g1_i4:90-2000(+)
MKRSFNDLITALCAEREVLEAELASLKNRADGCVASLEAPSPCVPDEAHHYAPSQLIVAGRWMPCKAEQNVAVLEILETDIAKSNVASCEALGGDQRVGKRGVRWGTSDERMDPDDMDHLDITPIQDPPQDTETFFGDSCQARYSRGVQTDASGPSLRTQKTAVRHSLTSSKSSATLASKGIITVDDLRSELERDHLEPRTVHEAILMGRQSEFLAFEVSARVTLPSSQVTSTVELSRQFLRKVLRCKAFDAFIAGFVFLDFIFLGLDAQDRLHPESTSVALRSLSETMSLVCKAVYFLELCARLAGFGFWCCWQSLLVRLDAFLVACTIAESIVEWTSSTVIDGALLKKLLVVRVLRVIRLLRMARVSVHLRTLWLLVSGLGHSASTIFWTFALIFRCDVGALFCASCADAALRSGTQAERVAVTHFGTLVDAMLTLLQVLTLDSVGMIYRPMIAEGQTKMSILCAIYFMLYIFFVSISLMNLVTAVMVEGSLAQAAQDQDFMKKMAAQRKTRLLPEILTMFEDLDLDGSAEICMQELVDAPEALKDRLVQITGTDNPAELFCVLDINDDGFLTVEEFMIGLMKSARGADFMDFKLNKIMRQTDMLKHFLLDGLSLDETERMATVLSTSTWASGS